jgi:hypothetical protein
MSTSPHTTTRPPGFLVTHDQRTRQSHALWARHALVSDVVNSHLIALGPKLERTYHLCDERVLDETMVQSLDRKIDLVFGAYSAFVENLTLIVHDLRTFFRSLLPSLTADEVTFLATQLAVGVSQWRVLNQLDQRYPAILPFTTDHGAQQSLISRLESAVHEARDSQSISLGGMVIDRPAIESRSLWIDLVPDYDRALRALRDMQSTFARLRRNTILAALPGSPESQAVNQPQRPPSPLLLSKREQRDPPTPYPKRRRK